MRYIKYNIPSMSIHTSHSEEDISYTYDLSYQAAEKRNQFAIEHMGKVRSLSTGMNSIQTTIDLPLPYVLQAEELRNPQIAMLLGCTKDTHTLKRIDFARLAQAFLTIYPLMVEDFTKAQSSSSLTIQRFDKLLIPYEAKQEILTLIQILAEVNMLRFISKIKEKKVTLLQLFHEIEKSIGTLEKHINDMDKKKSGYD